MVSELKQVDWKDLGVQLNIPYHIIETIDKKNTQNESRKLPELLYEWRSNHVPSWEKVTEALQRLRGGYPRVVASIQSRTNPLGKTCSMHGFPTILYTVCILWYVCICNININGDALMLHIHVLFTACMLSMWFQNKPEASWEKLCLALNEIGCDTSADEIRRQFVNIEEMEAKGKNYSVSNRL